MPYRILTLAALSISIACAVDVRFHGLKLRIDDSTGALVSMSYAEAETFTCGATAPLSS